MQNTFSDSKKTVFMFILAISIKKKCITTKTNFLAFIAKYFYWYSTFLIFILTSYLAKLFLRLIFIAIIIVNIDIYYIDFNS